jgi:hypothetical protein
MLLASQTSADFDIVERRLMVHFRLKEPERSEAMRLSTCTVFGPLRPWGSYSVPVSCHLAGDQFITVVAHAPNALTKSSD